jgi:hypothetical protein
MICIYCEAKTFDSNMCHTCYCYFILEECNMAGKGARAGRRIRRTAIGKGPGSEYTLYVLRAYPIHSHDEYIEMHIAATDPITAGQCMEGYLPLAKKHWTYRVEMKFTPGTTYGTEWEYDGYVCHCHKVLVREKLPDIGYGL